MLFFLVLGFLALPLSGVHAQWDPNSTYLTPNTYPTPNITGAGGWEEALFKARKFLNKLTAEEKTLIMNGQFIGPCVGSIRPVPRVGFNGLCLQDGPLAIRLADYASVFPAGVTVAASWDKKLARLRGMYLGQEYRAKGSHVALGPVVGPLGRYPLGGRNWEGFSPDPYLTGQLAAETVIGTQSAGTQACVKHFIGNEQTGDANPWVNDNGTTIEAYSVNIDDRTMHELYLWPFADTIKAGAASMMCSYQRVNSTYACQNSKALNGLLKGELNFQGYVTSDWGATYEHLIPNVNGGQDMNMPGDDSWDNITLAMNNGSIAQSRIDDMILRIMTPYYLLGQDKNFPDIDPSSAALNGYDATEAGYPYPVGGEVSRDVRGNHAALIRELGAAAVVLLKNVNGILPLKAPPKVIGVFGNDAPDESQGLYSQPSFYNQGTLTVGAGSGSGRLSYVVSPLEAIKAWAATKESLVQYITENSQVITEPASSGPTGSSAIFGSIYPVPDVCFVFLKYYVSEGPDHSDYLLNNNGTEVANTVANSCSNTIVVTHSGNGNVLPFADHPNITAILLGHLPGQESGNSILDVITGVVNPSGKLPYTIAFHASDYNIGYSNFSGEQITDPNGAQMNYSEGLSIDYRYFDSADIQPRYEFGYGLSYSNFTITDLGITRNRAVSALPPTNTSTMPGGNPSLWEDLVGVTFQLHNSDGPDGATVCQVYLAFPDSTTPSGTPKQVLRGFSKDFLYAGQSQEISLSLMRRDVSYWNVTAQDWQIPAGEFEVKVGFSSRDIRATGTFTLL